MEMFDHLGTAQQIYCQMSAISFNTSPLQVRHQLKEKNIGIKKNPRKTPWMQKVK